MSAPIVYEGQAQGSGGTLFKDMVFWVAQQVPMRSTWIQNIESNGGTIVKLDKNAQYLIADHARKNAPTGAYSWKWIEDSVKGGELLEAEKYVIKPPGRESRPVGSVKQKATRTPFTADDDMILARFVTKYERAGEATAGNEIYKELEKQHPHHTFQSWRDRWVKKLQFQPRPKDLSPLPDRRPSERVSRAPRAPLDAPVNPSPSPKKTRTKFTAEEDALIIEHTAQCAKMGKKVLGKAIYEDFAKDFPSHSWQSWRERYTKILAPSLEQAPESEDDPQPETPRASTRSTRRAQPQPETPRALPDKDAEPLTAPTVAAVSRTAGTALERAPEDERGPQPVRASTRSTRSTRRTQPETPNASSSKDAESPTIPTVSAVSHAAGVPETDVEEGHDPIDAPESPDPGASREKDSSPGPTNDETEARGDDTESAVVETPAGKISEQANQKQVQSTPHSVDAFKPEDLVESKETFYTFLGGYLESETQVDTPAYWPTICGQTFELWSLWKAVMAQKVEPAERDWQQISEELGFDWIQLPNAPDEVRECYEKTLSGFETELLNYRLDEDDEPEEPVDSPRPGTMVGFSDGRFNSSPPKQPSLKRSYEVALDSDHVYPDVARKRSRVDRDSEIPSTPDVENGASRLRHPVSAGVSPSDNRLSRLPMSSRSPGKSRGARQMEPEDEEMRDQVSDLPAMANVRRVATEPETQDFRFDTQVQEEGGLQEEVQDEEVTPSQQLHSEIIQEAQRRHFQEPGTPTPKRNAKSPFLADDNEDEPNTITPKPQYGKGPNPLLSHPELLHAKPRPVGVPYRGTPKPSAQARPSSSELARLSNRGSASPRHGRSPTPQARAAPSPAPQPQTEAERLGEVVEYWMSLGYSRETARRSLEATTWEPGLAGRLMQMLKNGEAIPTNWEGVWTSRDDENLALVDSAVPPKDDKEARKRARAEDKLMNKHGQERIALRRKWLATKAGL